VLPEKREIAQSTIGFPYGDLESGISVAQAIFAAGGVALSREQLAGVMKLQVGSGNFVTKVATARIFGLVTYVQSKYELSNIGFAILDSDEKRQRQARAEAFLSVPLYKRVYEDFRGKQLPPRPLGLEQAFVTYGVAPKQKTNARLAFDKSAKQAGFFSAGPERLIEPIIGGTTPQSERRGAPDEEGNGGGRGRTGSYIDSEASGLHPFIQGLLGTLPEPQTNWTVEGRAKWLQAAANIFDLMYKGSGEIHITAKGDPRPAERTGDGA